MVSVLMQPRPAYRVTVYDERLERSEDLGLIRHRLKSLAEARAICGLRPTEETEYRRLCEREQELLEATRLVVVR